MEITKDNFNPEIFKSALEGAEFVTFDCEFSGLTLDPKDKRHAYDSTETIYQKMKEICSNYFAFQIGLCVFKWNKEIKKYQCCPFNFYVYPSSKLQDHVLNFQASTFEFLTEHKMNWTTVFKNGIHYWQRTKREELIHLTEKYIRKDSRNNRNYVKQLGSKSQKDLDESLQLVHEFLNTPVEEKTHFALPANKNRVCWTAIINELKRLERERTDIRVKNIEKESKAIITKFPPSKKDIEKAEKAQEEEVKQTAEQLAQLEISEEDKVENEIKEMINQQYGFTAIIDQLIESKVPIVGHNMIYDVMFLYNQFVDAFPHKYADFAKSWGKLFTTYDTKLMCCYSTFVNKTWLKEAYDQCLNNPSLMDNIHFEYHPDFMMYDEEVQEHEAAYDAYMTGVVFATIAMEKEITHEFHSLLDENSEYQELIKKLQSKPAPTGPVAKKDIEEEKVDFDKEEVIKRIKELKGEAINKTRAECKSKVLN